jgi:hypothetical protein
MVEDADDVTAPEQEPLADKSGTQRTRSGIAFPYSDLEAAIGLARAIHLNAVSCDDTELAAWMNMSADGGTYRGRRSAARMFGLINLSQNRLSLTDLGRRSVDEADRSARAEAFLKPALFIALHDQYRGQTLPPQPTIERHIERLGVPPKQIKRARQVFQTSAHYAGFIDPGSGRFRKPGIGPSPEPAREDGDKEEAGLRRSGGGGGTPPPPRHPLIEGMFKSLPNDGEPWTLEEAADWLHAAAYNLRFAYKLKGKITIDIKIEQPVRT